MGLVKLQRAVKYGPPSLVLASLARDAVEDAGLEGDAGLYTPKALSPAFQGDVHQIESLVNSVGKHRTTKPDISEQQADRRGGSQDQTGRLCRFLQTLAEMQHGRHFHPVEEPG